MSSSSGSESESQIVESFEWNPGSNRSSSSHSPDEERKSIPKEKIKSLSIEKPTINAMKRQSHVDDEGIDETASSDTSMSIESVEKFVEVDQSKINKMFKQKDIEGITSFISSMNYSSRMSYKGLSVSNGKDIFDHLKILKKPDDFFCFSFFFMEREQADSEALKRAIKDRNLEMVTRILVLKPKERIERMKQEFKSRFGKDLEKQVNGITRDKQFVDILLNCERYSRNDERSTIIADAKSIFSSMANMTSAGVATVFLTYSRECFKSFCQVFYSSNGFTVMDCLSQTNIPQDIKACMRIIHDSSLSPMSYILRLIHILLTTGGSRFYAGFFLSQLEEKNIKMMLDIYELQYGRDLLMCLDKVFGSKVKKLYTKFLAKSH